MYNRITVSFLPKRDADLIRFLEEKKDGNLSEYIRQLIRNDKERKTMNLDNKEELINQILQKIESLEGKSSKDADFIEDSLTKGKVEDTINNLF